jgi:xanthine dehydrogenase accessory factor
MRNESELWDFAFRRLNAGRHAMLLVVAESSGSSPGCAGFKMVVGDDDMVGSVGGGVMEVALVDGARSVLADQSKIINQKSKIETLVHRPDVANASGMICSGSQTVIVCPLDERDLETVRKIRDVLHESREIGIRITNEGICIVESPGSREIRFWSDNGRPPEGGTPNGDTLKWVYEETLGRTPKLFIVGGGHCALALSELMSKLGFHIELFDDRGDLNTLEKNVFANRKTIIESYEAIGDLIESGSDRYVVVMTLGYKFDEMVIRRLFLKNFRYFGVLGSKAKMATLLKSLRKEGFDADRLSRIRTPIGIPINSRTPEEIAVSIAAEIIAVKNA